MCKRQKAADAARSIVSRRIQRARGHRCSRRRRRHACVTPRRMGDITGPPSQISAAHGEARYHRWRGAKRGWGGGAAYPSHAKTPRVRYFLGSPPAPGLVSYGAAERGGAMVQHGTSTACARALVLSLRARLGRRTGWTPGGIAAERASRRRRRAGAGGGRTAAERRQTTTAASAAFSIDLPKGRPPPPLPPPSRPQRALPHRPLLPLRGRRLRRRRLQRHLGRRSWLGGVAGNVAAGGATRPRFIAKEKKRKKGETALAAGRRSRQALADVIRGRTTRGGLAAAATGRRGWRPATVAAGGWKAWVLAPDRPAY